MHLTYIILQDPSRERHFITGGRLDTQRLRGVGRIFIHAMAWSETRGLDNALAVLAQHPDFEPTPEELCDRVLPSSHGHWREVVEWAAYLTLKYKLEADLEAEIRLIETSIDIATAIGENVVGLMPARETGNPHSFEGIALTVQRQGYPEVLWLEVERPDACPEDADGLHFIGCGCEL